MSHIPNSAMPHAGPTETIDEQDGHTATMTERATEAAGKIADNARENPKTAIAAGAALAAGALAAAAIPLVRGRTGSGAKKTGGAKKGASKKG